jgi:N-acetylglucosaminyldiphosphoundecaprenol N-acetyl-beta-D-mannosaminyltransferase
MVTPFGPAEGAAGTPIRKLFGIPIAALTLAEALERVEAAIRDRSRLQIGVVNAAKVVNMQRDALLRDDVLSSDLILADGIAVVWAGRLLGRRLPARVAGIDLMAGILRRGAERGWRVFCLGATEEVLDRAAARMLQDHPGIQVVGRQHGYFTADQEAEVARAIAAASPDVLFVAMTSPKKEKFLARWSEEIGVPVCHGVGGSFDVLAGKVRRAPALWQRLGLEWLYRVLQEPGRLWKRYLVTNTLFCWMVLKELLARPAARPADPPGR